MNSSRINHTDSVTVDRQLWQIVTSVLASVTPINAKLTQIGVDDAERYTLSNIVQRRTRCQDIPVETVGQWQELGDIMISARLAMTETTSVPWIHQAVRSSLAEWWSHRPNHMVNLVNVNIPMSDRWRIAKRLTEEGCLPFPAGEVQHWSSAADIYSAALRYRRSTP